MMWICVNVGMCRREFFRGIASGATSVLYPMLDFLLSDVEPLKEKAYVGRYTTVPFKDVPPHIQTDTGMW